PLPPPALLFLPSFSSEPQMGASMGSGSLNEPSQGLPQFVTVGYLDGQVFVYYDSHTQKKQPRVSWIEKYVGKEDPQYWDRETQISRRKRGSLQRERLPPHLLKSPLLASQGSRAGPRGLPLVEEGGRRAARVEGSLLSRLNSPKGPNLSSKGGCSHPPIA
uniref:MHC class I-like antigen recognition-like domain-containing protein n=1 Tax=Naja naja TaxID=35670 RepID=A0A8C6Y1I9_NAJNA